jgi:hypothetical protein
MLAIAGVFPPMYVDGRYTTDEPKNGSQPFLHVANTLATNLGRMPVATLGDNSIGQVCCARASLQRTALASDRKQITVCSHEHSLQVHNFEMQHHVPADDLFDSMQTLLKVFSVFSLLYPIFVMFISFAPPPSSEQRDQLFHRRRARHAR